MHIYNSLRVALIASVLVACVQLSGCSSQATNAESSSDRLAPSLSQLFQIHLDSGQELSDTQRQILEQSVVDGHISVSNYELSHNEQDACFKDHGVSQPWRKATNGVYIQLGVDISKQGITSDQYYAANEDCAYLATVPTLYAIQMWNPNLYSDGRLVTIDCLQSANLVDSSYTVDDLSADIASTDLQPFPFDPFDPIANQCLYAGGFGYFDDSDEG